MNEVIVLTKSKDQILVKHYVTQCANRYKNFMRIDNMPKFDVKPFDINMADTIKNGFGAFASQNYNVNTGEQLLNIWVDMYKPQFHGEYILFHEFTHMLDTDKYSQQDKEKNVAIKGYLEYHAAQIDLIKLLGADFVDSKISFSMKQEIQLFTKKKTVIDYVQEARKTVLEILNRPDFPANYDMLLGAIGLIYNYFGRLSICRMYATDYDEYAELLEDMKEEKEFIGEIGFNALKVFLKGWLTEPQIEVLSGFNLKMLLSLATEKYKLV